VTHDAINGTDKVNIEHVYSINMRQAKQDFTRENLAVIEERKIYQARIKGIDFISVSMILQLYLGTIVSIFVVVGVICCRGFYFSDAALSYQQEVKIPGK
jgi:hypothetical protein